MRFERYADNIFSPNFLKAIVVGLIIVSITAFCIFRKAICVVESLKLHSNYSYVTRLIEEGYATPK